jgi:hypothetical protein
MATRFLLKRAIAIGLAALLIVVACLCYLRYAEDQASLWHWLRFGYMAALNADLSKAGEYSVSFEARDIDPALELEVPKDVGSRMSAEELLAGLQATSQLIGPDGKVVYSGGIPQYTVRVHPPGSGRICLVEYGYDTVGWHKVNVAITQPALALKGVPHRLIVVSHGRNIDARLVMRARLFAGHAALLTAAVILITVVITSRRKPNLQNNNQGKTE